MKIENVPVTEGKCSFCENRASKRLDGILYCSSCADPELIKQIGHCIKAVEHAIVSIKVMPKETMLKESATHGK